MACAGFILAGAEKKSDGAESRIFGGRDNIKIREVAGGVLASAPSALPDSFFRQGQKHTISNYRGGILSVGAYAPPVLKQHLYASVSTVH